MPNKNKRPPPFETQKYQDCGIYLRYGKYKILPINGSSKIGHFNIQNHSKWDSPSHWKVEGVEKVFSIFRSGKALVEASLPEGLYLKND